MANIDLLEAAPGRPETDETRHEQNMAFIAVEQGRQRMSEAEATITFLATPESPDGNKRNRLKDLVDDPRAEWTGGISVDKRIERGEITAEQVEHAKRSLGSFFVPTREGGVVGCIDGRTKVGFIRNSAAAIKEKFGPKIPGGTLAGGVSYRHAVSSFFSQFKNRTIVDDARTFAEASENKGGYLPGDHSAHPDKPGLGCGAVDGLEETHKKVNPNNINTLYGLTKGVLGDDFSEEHFSHFVSSAQFLAANDSYFDSKQQAIDELAALHHEALPELEGEHFEVILCINRKRGTTLNTDLFNTVMKEETGVELQAFDYDLWYTEDMARALFPDSVEQQQRFVHCRLAKAIATLMYLTDGTLQVAVRDAVHEVAREPELTSVA